MTNNKDERKRKWAKFWNINLKINIIARIIAVIVPIIFMVFKQPIMEFVNSKREVDNNRIQVEENIEPKSSEAINEIKQSPIVKKQYKYRDHHIQKLDEYINSSLISTLFPNGASDAEESAYIFADGGYYFNYDYEILQYITIINGYIGDTSDWYYPGLPNIMRGTVTYKFSDNPYETTIWIENDDIEYDFIDIIYEEGSYTYKNIQEGDEIAVYGIMDYYVDHSADIGHSQNMMHAIAIISNEGEDVDYIEPGFQELYYGTYEYSRYEKGKDGLYQEERGTINITPTLFDGRAYTINTMKIYGGLLEVKFRLDDTEYETDIYDIMALDIDGVVAIYHNYQDGEFAPYHYYGCNPDLWNYK